MSFFPQRSYNLDVSRGLVPGVSAVNKFGRNPDVDIGTEDIWSQGGTWVAPTTARVHAIVSSSVNDTSAGTGARTVYIEGLDGSYVVTTETVTMNGVTPVNTANSYVIVHRMYVLTAGSGATNAGTITATAATDATVSIAIVIGKAQSQLCIYQVPTGYTAYISSYLGSFNGAANSNVDVELFVKPFGGVFNLKSTVTLGINATCAALRTFDTPLVVSAKSIIKLTATSDTNNSNVVGSFDLILVAS
jgi:hypothetical protein